MELGMSSLAKAAQLIVTGLLEFGGNAAIATDNIASDGLAVPTDPLQEAVVGVVSKRLGNAAADAVDGPGAAEEEGLPTLTISKARNPDLAAHIDDAQAAGQPSVLTRLQNAAQQNANRQSSLLGVPRAPSGMQLDEYPFASTHEGGAGASVRAIPSGQNSSQGALLRNFYQSFGIQDGDRFIVNTGP
jgi:hypothetical protein